MSIKVAIVTGASRGIGRSIAQELSKTYQATYRGNREAAESLRAESGAEIVQSDISSAHDRETLASTTIEKFGRIDRHEPQRASLPHTTGSSPNAATKRRPYCLRHLDQRLHQRRMGEPSDIAKVTRAIADGLLDYCAGQVLHADGGFHMRTL